MRGVSMRKAQGYAITTEPGKRDVEEDTFTCCHCNSLVFVSDPKTGAPVPPDQVGGFCTLCYAHTCTKCADIGGCEPFEKKMEKMEARDRLMRAAMSR